MSAWLVDTHAVLWFLGDDERLSDDARRTMEDGESILYLSSASVCEMAIKASLGKLALPDDFAAAVEEERFEELDISFAHAWALRDLPVGAHRDPFDRILVAQALIEAVPVISNDVELDQYGVERIW